MTQECKCQFTSCNQQNTRREINNATLHREQETTTYKTRSQTHLVYTLQQHWLWVFAWTMTKMWAVITKHLLTATLCCWISTLLWLKEKNETIQPVLQCQKESKLWFVTWELGHCRVKTCRAESCKILPLGSLRCQSGQPEEVVDFVHRGEHTELFPSFLHSHILLQSGDGLQSNCWLVVSHFLCSPNLGVIDKQ